MALWLVASMNFQVVYQCPGGAPAFDLPVKFTVTSLSLVWYFVFSRTWICGAFFFNLRVGGVWFYTLGTCGVSSTTLGTRGVKISTLENWLPCCGCWVSGSCTAHLEFSDKCWWQTMQVLQLLMVMPVLGFPGHVSIVMLQFLLRLLRMFWAYQHGEGRSQLCMKFYCI